MPDTVTLSHLDQLIAELEAEEALVAERLDLARKLRQSFDPSRTVTPAADPEPDSEPDSESAPAKPRRRKAGTLRCPHCDTDCDGGAELAAHLAAAHPSEPKRDRAKPGPRRNPVTCPHCGQTCANGTGLAAHIRTRHPEVHSTNRERTTPAKPAKPKRQAPEPGPRINKFDRNRPTSAEVAELEAQLA